MKISCLGWVAVMSCLPFTANATLGVFEQGSGIKALGDAGISFVDAEETTAIPANPASTLDLGRRFDIGIDLLMPDEHARIVGNSLGPDQTYDSNARHQYFIPQGGFSLPLSPTWAVGVSAYAGGLGPDYSSSPYARFATPDNAAASKSAGISLKIAGLALATAHRILPGQTLGVALNIQRETLELKGLAPFEALSEYPDNVTDIGKHGALGGSLAVGWTGVLTPWLNGGASYRSKSWSQHISEYRGILPDAGRLELPAIYGGALAAKPFSRLQIAFEFERQQYGSRHAFGNRIEPLEQGALLGSDDGPGFGWGNQNAYKLGLTYQALQQLRLRAGYIYATPNFPPSQTLFNILAPATLTTHYSAGATWTFRNRYELSGYFALAARRTVEGRNSIPQSFGGGEADVSNEIYHVGVTIGRTLGN